MRIDKVDGYNLFSRVGSPEWVGIRWEGNNLWETQRGNFFTHTVVGTWTKLAVEMVEVDKMVTFKIHLDKYTKRKGLVACGTKTGKWEELIKSVQYAGVGLGNPFPRSMTTILIEFLTNVMLLLPLMQLLKCSYSTMLGFQIYAICSTYSKSSRLITGVVKWSTDWASSCWLIIAINHQRYFSLQTQWY